MRYLTNVKIIAAMVVTLLVATAGPVVAHGVEHALFAHNADKVDGLHATQVQGKAVQAGLSRSSIPANLDSYAIASATISAPKAGGAVVATGVLNPDWQNSGTFGIVWIAIDQTCADGAGDAWWDTYSSIAESVTAVLGKKVSAGSHIARFCATGFADGATFTDTSVPFVGGNLTAVWVPSTGTIAAPSTYGAASVSALTAGAPTGEPSRAAQMKRAAQRR